MKLVIKALESLLSQQLSNQLLCFVDYSITMIKQHSESMMQLQVIVFKNKIYTILSNILDICPNHWQSQIIS